MKYTLTFDKREISKFNAVLSRLEPEDYTIVEEIHNIDPVHPHHHDRRVVVEMDEYCALTFRLGMKEVHIRKERTEEELAAEKTNDDRHKVKITLVVPPDQMPPSP